MMVQYCQYTDSRVQWYRMVVNESESDRYFEYFSFHFDLHLPTLDPFHSRFRTDPSLISCVPVSEQFITILSQTLPYISIIDIRMFFDPFRLVWCVWFWGGVLWGCVIVGTVRSCNRRVNHTEGPSRVSYNQSYIVWFDFHIVCVMGLYIPTWIRTDDVSHSYLCNHDHWYHTTFDGSRRNRLESIPVLCSFRLVLLVHTYPHPQVSPSLGNGSVWCLTESHVSFRTVEEVRASYRVGVICVLIPYQSPP